jgi:hypothetical protein
MNEKIVALIDVDGTISLVGDRLKHLQKESSDWNAFFNAYDEDLPNEIIIKVVELLHYEYNIVFCTGKPESVRDKTEGWIKEHLPFLGSDYELLMRSDGDYRHDSEVKPEMLEAVGIFPDDIAIALDDRNSMVSLWRSRGITCLQVADGNF